ncbi:MAG: hypothetical protein JW749_06955 [Sedimentisphaerales bacterium]|nr:hypothetical protein [Sedimentisphaerales bacterium]
MKEARWGLLMLFLGMWAILFEIGRAIKERSSFQLKEWGFFLAFVVLEMAMILAGAKLLKRTKVLGPLFCVIVAYLFSCRICYIQLKEAWWGIFVIATVMVLGMTVAVSLMLKRW